MPDRSWSVPHSRRAFLKAAGVVAGMAVGLPALGGCSTTMLNRVARRWGPLTVGVLLPQSATYPALRSSLLGGLQLGAAHGDDSQLSLVVEHIGAGQRAAELGALKLLEQGVALIAGVINPCVSPLLHHALDDHNALLVIADTGANIPRASESHERVFGISLGDWQAAYALGRWAAQELGTRAAIVASLYESGYDTVYAFRRGLESAGGTLTGTFVSHRPIDPADHLGPLLAEVHDSRPDAVFALQSGRDARELLVAYSDSRLAVSTPLLSVSHLWSSRESFSGTAYAAVPWSASLPAAPNRVFRDAYRAATSREPDMFAVLGHDVAQLIAAALDGAGGDPGDIARLRQSLSTIAITSPRGTIAMRAATGVADTPVYLATIDGDQQRLMPGVALATPSAGDSQLADLRAGQRSGWTQSYLCI